MVQSIDWLAIAPPLTVALTAVLVLMVDAFGRGRAFVRHHAVPAIAGIGASFALLLLLPLIGNERRAFCMLGGCSYEVDPTTLVFDLIAAGGVLVVVLLSTRREPHLPAGEYHFLLLCSAAGAMTIAGARDLITLAVALELVTLPAIALVGLRARDDRAAEAALKFFLVSVVSVAVMLFGISLVYGMTGSVQLAAIARALPAAPTSLAGVGIVLTLVGLLFKVGAVPFHFWVPETYAGAPIPVAAYLSVVSKAAGLVGVLVVLTRGFGAYAPTWAPVIGGLAALTMTIGNLVALRQTDAVRLLAWSSIAQAGFVLVPLGGGEPGPAVAYLLIYAVVNLGAFTVVAMAGGGSLERFRGMVRTNRWLASGLAFFLLALAGLPPAVIGLFGKVVVIQAAVRGDATWLAVVAALNVAIGLAYYLRWAALLFAPVEERPWRAVATRPAWVAFGVVAGLGVLLSVVPELVLGVLTHLSSMDAIGSGAVRTLDGS